MFDLGFMFPVYVKEDFEPLGRADAGVIVFILHCCPDVAREFVGVGDVCKENGEDELGGLENEFFGAGGEFDKGC